MATRLEADLTLTKQAMRNIHDGISLVRTAEGALSTSDDILIQNRIFSVQTANDTYSTADRSRILTEMSLLFDSPNGEFFR